MKKALPILIVIIVIVGGWYFLTKDKSTDNVPTNSTGRSLSLTMSEVLRSSQSGTVNLFEQGNQTRIEINLRNAPPDQGQPAHIHRGSCDLVEDVKYPLEPVVNGVSVTVIDANYDDLLADSPLVINVHKSAEEPNIYVSCADINSPVSSSNMPIQNSDVDEAMAINEKENNQDAVEQPAPIVFNITGQNFTFSQKEILVKKGNTVTINFSSTGGFHDWTVDGFNAKTDQVAAGDSASVSFTADQVGTFEYYCSVGQHRAQGMKGNLVVEE